MTARILVIDEVSTIHRTSPSVQATISVGKFIDTVRRFLGSA